MRRWIVVTTMLALLAAAFVPLVGAERSDADLPWDLLRGSASGNHSVLSDEAFSLDLHHKSLKFNEITPFFTFGSDDRVRMSPPDPRVAFLAIGWDELPDGIGVCSATFIGPNVLLTAAHCLYDSVDGLGMADKIVVYPGLNGESPEQAPFGRFEATWWYIPQIYADTPYPDNFEYDVAAVLLDQNIGNQVGMMSLGVLSDQSLSSPSLWETTIGYPGDKPLATQWKTAISALVDFDDSYIYSHNDIWQGQSGSAVFRAVDEAIFGVVSGGREFSDGTQINFHRRITEAVLGFFDGVCVDAGCSYNSFIEEAEPPELTPTATSSPTASPSPTAPPSPTTSPSPTAPPSPTASPSPTAPPSPTNAPGPGPAPATDAGQAAVAFQNTWQRTDQPVSFGSVSRTWMWGPQANTVVLQEPYLEGASGNRNVVYYDKSRMEIATDPTVLPDSPWYVTNGLLATELITGRMQLGNGTFQQYPPAQVNAAGDSDDLTGPTYATFGKVLNAPPLSLGSVVTQTIDRAGNVTVDPNMASYGVTVAHFDQTTGHTVASVFWDFMNSVDLVNEDGVLIYDNLFENPFYATGLPITEPYWATVKVAGTYRSVLIQAFERRILTYTPGNSPGFEVEAGNVGQHYYHWRYEVVPG